MQLCSSMVGLEEIMKAIQVINSVLLAGILAVLMFSSGFFNQAKHADGRKFQTSSAELSKKTAQSVEDEQLQRILLHPLRQVFKFPESLKFKNVHFNRKYLYTENGFTLSNKDEDDQVIEMCGFYSAQNAMGVHGKYEKFVIIAGLSPSDKAIGGKVYFENDYEIQYLMSLDGRYPFDADRNEFDDNWERLCGDYESLDMGVFDGYKFDFAGEAPIYTEKSIVQYSKNKPFVEEVNTCLSNDYELNSCFNVASCNISEGKSSDYCKVMLDTCLEKDNPEQCNAKVANYFKEKAKKQAETQEKQTKIQEKQVNIKKVIQESR